MTSTVVRVLWVDDDVRQDTAQVTLLANIGCAIDCATNAADAVKRIDEAVYDVILLDLHLPDRSGLDVLQLLSHVPAGVVILTAFGDVDSAVAAMKLGATDYREKPLDDAELVSLVYRESARAPDQAYGHPREDVRWIEGACDRLSFCVSRDECLPVICRLLLDRRLPLYSFVGVAQATQRLITSTEPSLALLISDVRHIILATVRATPTLRQPHVRSAMLSLERLSRREERLALCTRLNISRAYLNRLLVAHTGRPHHEWMKAVAMRVAVRRVLETTDRISQIAYDVGYQHASQFDRDFDETFGLSPRELRQRQTGWQ